ncbi:hypothetical protein [Microbacterium sp.]|uniref:hypothetical protein n=1 Tax=Microbacterium sp. TaxID=51671 RepID=UPI0039E2E3AB
MTSRRTLLKGAAWSVPTVAAMVVAPYAAATTPAPACADGQQSLTYEVDDVNKTIIVRNSASCVYTGTLTVLHGTYKFPARTIGPFAFDGNTGKSQVASGKILIGVDLGTRTIGANTSIVIPITIVPDQYGTFDSTLPYSNTDNIFVRDGSATGTNIAHGGAYVLTSYCATTPYSSNKLTLW